MKMNDLFTIEIFHEPIRDEGGEITCWEVRGRVVFTPDARVDDTLAGRAKELLAARVFPPGGCCDEALHLKVEPDSPAVSFSFCTQEPRPC